jgi:hypothetical protein
MKQSYIPPHKRNENFTNTKFQKEYQKEKIIKKSTKINKVDKLDINDTSQFPLFGNVSNTTSNTIIIESNKPTLSTIFKKSLLNKKKVIKPKMKKGWIHLTKQGIIDSLTPEERMQEEKAYDERIFQINLRRLCIENERKLEYRRNYDHTYLWEELRIVDEYEENESDDESDYDSYEEYSQNEDEYYDNYNKNKELW